MRRIRFLLHHYRSVGKIFTAKFRGDTADAIRMWITDVRPRLMEGLQTDHGYLFVTIDGAKRNSMSPLVRHVANRILGKKNISAQTIRYVSAGRHGQYVQYVPYSTV